MGANGIRSRGPRAEDVGGDFKDAWPIPTQEEIAERAEIIKSRAFFKEVGGSRPDTCLPESEIERTMVGPLDGKAVREQIIHDGGGGAGDVIAVGQVEQAVT